MASRPDVDLLYGVQEIADHLGRTYNQADWLVRRGEIPTFKMGDRVCATKTALAEHFARRAAAAAAAAGQA